MVRHVREHLFRARDDGSARLVGGTCASCGRVHFPAAEVCPYCSNESCGEVELGPRGFLWLYTSVLRAPPGYRGAVPFGFGIVDLEEGLRVVTRLTESDVTKLSPGQPMRLVVDLLHTDDDGEEVSTFAFAPEAPS